MKQEHSWLNGLRGKEIELEETKPFETILARKMNGNERKLNGNETKMNGN